MYWNNFEVYTHLSVKAHFVLSMSFIYFIERYFTFTLIAPCVCTCVYVLFYVIAFVYVFMANVWADFMLTKKVRIFYFDNLLELLHIILLQLSFWMESKSIFCCRCASLLLSLSHLWKTKCNFINRHFFSTSSSPFYLNPLHKIFTCMIPIFSTSFSLCGFSV